MNTLLSGFIAGLVVGAPIGPVGVLCLKRALTKGPAIGMASSLGSAAADTIIAGVAAFGLAFIADFLMQHKLLLHWIGGASMCLLGLKTMLILPDGKSQAGNGLDMAHAHLSALFLTLINPGIYLFLIAVLAALGIDAFSMGLRSSGLLLAGVFAGSLSWGILIAASAMLFHAGFSLRAAWRMHRICGLIIAAFGVAVLLSSKWPSEWSWSLKSATGWTILITVWLTTIVLDGIAYYLTSKDRGNNQSSTEQETSPH